MKTRLLLAAMAAMASVAKADDPRRWPDTSKITPYYTEDPRRWGTPSRIIEPKYPESALAEGRGGVVEVDALASPSSNLSDIKLKPQTAEAEVFVAPLREALKHWQVYVPTGNDCLPTGERVVFRVWFEVKDGKPKVSVSRGEHVRPSKQAVEVPLRSPSPAYPRSMAAKGNEADVYVLSIVDQAGDVIAVYTRLFSDDIDNGPFEPAVVKALRQWKYAPSASQEPRHFCNDVHFRIREP